jgi:hypothetical protein
MVKQHVKISNLLSLPASSTPDEVGGDWSICVKPGRGTNETELVDATVGGSVNVTGTQPRTVALSHLQRDSVGHRPKQLESVST